MNETLEQRALRIAEGVAIDHPHISAGVSGKWIVEFARRLLAEQGERVAVCAHGKAAYERCIECETGSGNGFIAPPKDALDSFLKECEAEAAHIEKNGSNLRIKFGDEHEGRCRELCAMYLREFIAAYRIGERITQFDAALSAQTKPGEAS